MFVAQIDATKVSSKNGPVSLDVIMDFAAGDKIDLSGLDANADVAGIQDFVWGGHSASKYAGDLTIRTFGNINAAEKALGIDIDGVDGPSSYNGPGDDGVRQRRRRRSRLRHRADRRERRRADRLPVLGSGLPVT